MSGAGPLLTLDRGNSTLDCMLSGDPATRRRLPADDLEALDGLLARRPEIAVGCSVVAGGLRQAAERLERAGIPLLIAGDDLPCPLQLRYPQPQTLGVDRWVAAFAAYRQFGDAVVFDCGSAITVDGVTSAGVFLGGAIAPGLAAMAAGLRDAAPALPSADPTAAVDSVPVSSQQAVDTGVELSFCGAVERLFAEISTRAGLEGAPAVLTGGDAELYLRRGRLPCEWIPDLVHRGLCHLWQRDTRAT